MDLATIVAAKKYNKKQHIRKKIHSYTPQNVTQHA
jgi:hypothetical protein